MKRSAVLFQSTPGARLNPVKGCYTALALFLPLVVLGLLGHVAFGGQVMFGALLTAFGNVGPFSRMQAKSLLMIAVGGAFMTALGRLIGGLWWVEGIEIFLVVLLSGLLAAFGQAIAGVGSLLTIIFVLSLSTRAGPATAWSSAVGFLLGGASLLVFALVFARLQAGHRIPENEAHSRIRPALNTLTTRLTWTSPLFRFSVLRALGAAVASGIGWVLSGPYPYWAALTVIICARPQKRASMVLILQNIVATLLGAVLADLTIALVQSDLVRGLLAIPVTFLAFTVKELNYVLHLFFLTNLILLVASIGHADHAFIAWRVLAILIGSGIVLVITALNQAWLVKNEAVPEVS
ncbi:hypothetical protein KSF_100130 [Reticulibacter mediterranei]|uniref:Integral membrane bound transporter domain-containing protein n=2 Tax=Reticulibacter mediterranei TaxID=2778369 RepID=A0A8J3IWU3_9CHLR|nr:hypothetical protein KSF_100130 [Reticulibacter mediterranei]